MKKYLFSAFLFSIISCGFCGLGVNSGFHYKTSYYDYTDIFGRWEVRSKIVPHLGLVTAFCLLHDCNNAEDSMQVAGDSLKINWAEVDIEVTGLENNRIQSVAHIYNNQTFFDRPYCVQYFDYYEGYYEQYHTYTIEWTPFYVAWELDGKPYRLAAAVEGGTRDISYAMYDDGDTKAGDIVRDTTYELDWVVQFRVRHMRFAFDTWICKDPSWCPDWAGEFNQEDFAGNAVFYSWFKKYDYTPGEGDNGSNFTLVDYDDFTGDSIDFDTSIWAAAYDVYMKDGKAVAKMQWPLTKAIPDDPGDTAGTEPSPLNDYSSAVINSRNFGYKSSESLEFSNGKIRYNIGVEGNLLIQLHSLNGRLVSTLAQKFETCGIHSFTPNLSSVSSGAYILSIKTPAGRTIRTKINAISR